MVHLTIPKPRKHSQWIFGDNLQFRKDFLKIEEQGFKIGIGVATGLDSIFIGKNLHGIIEDELLLPIVLSRDIKEGGINWSGNNVINPFKESGGLKDLSQYPLAQKYFNMNRAVLRNRYIARKNPNNWYRTIDKIHASLVKMSKLLIPDITNNAVIALDEGSFYPHHNIYYITNSSIENLKILGALLLSCFSLQQITNVSVKMRGGYVRWQAQNLRKIYLPEINHIPISIKSELVTHFDKRDVRGIEDITSHYLR